MSLCFAHCFLYPVFSLRSAFCADHNYSNYMIKVAEHSLIHVGCGLLAFIRLLFKNIFVLSSNLV